MTSKEREFQYYLSLLSQGIIGKEVAIDAFNRTAAPPQMPRIMMPTPAEMESLGIPPSRGPERRGKSVLEGWPVGDLAMIFAIDPGQTYDDPFEIHTRPSLRAVPGQQQAIDRTHRRFTNPEYFISTPQPVGRLPLRVDMPIQAERTRLGEFLINPDPAIRFENISLVSTAMDQYGPLMPEPEGLKELHDRVDSLCAELKVAYDTIKGQEAELKELRDRRDDALTRPIFRRTLSNLT